MPLLNPDDYDHYLNLNTFTGASEKLIEDSIKSKVNDKRLSGKLLVDALRMELIVSGPYEKVCTYMGLYKEDIRDSGPENQLRLFLLDAEIARQKGFYIKGYSILVELQKKLRRSARPEALSESEWEDFRRPMLASVNLLAGKCLAKNADHAMARIHFGLAYDHRHFSDTKSYTTQHYSDAQVRTAFARSYFEWRKMENIDDLLQNAENCYRKHFPTQHMEEGAHPDHLYLSEVYTIRARYESVKSCRRIRRKTDPLKRAAERRFLYLKIDDLLKQAEEIVLKILGSKHRRYAHVLRLKALFKWEYCWEQIQEYKGRIPLTMLQRLEDIVQLYKNEIQIRTEFFGTTVHPSIARANNYLALIHLTKSECYAQVEDKDSFMAEMELADMAIKAAVTANHKGEEDWNLTASGHKLKQNIHYQTKILRDKISDHQAFQSKLRCLELEALRYRYADSWRNDVWKARKGSFQRIKDLYVDCSDIFYANLQWMTSPDSHEAFYEKFEIAQEAFIEICYAEYNNPLRNTDDYKVVEDALFAMQQGSLAKARIDEVFKNAGLDQVEHNKLLRQFQTSNYRRLTDDKDIQSWVDFEEDQKSYYKNADKLISNQRKLNKKTHNSQSSLASWNDQGGFKFQSIAKGFTKTREHSNAIALHFGKRHAYAIAIHDARKLDGKLLTFRRVTDDFDDFRGVVELKMLARKFNQNFKKFTTLESLVERQPGESKEEHEKEVGKLKKRLLFSNTFSFDPGSEDLADQLNSKLLIYGYQLYDKVFRRLGIGANDRFYIGINRYRWQRIPIRTIFMLDPFQEFAIGDQVRFSNYTQYFIGTHHQVSVMPSIMDLWRWGTTEAEKHHSGSSRLFTLSGGSEVSKSKRFAQVASRSVIDVQKCFYSARKRLTPGSNFDNRVIKAEKGTSKQLIEAEMIAATFIYLFLHTEKEKNLDGRRKMKFYEAQEIERPVPGFIRAFHWDKFSLYLEEIENMKLTAKLAFINGCSSADGRGRHTHTPYSLLSAVYEAGAKAVIGTQALTYATAMSPFAKIFYEYWACKGISGADNEERLVSIGEALQRTSRALLKDETGGKNNHPLHWGVYLQIGDMTMCLDKII